MYNYFNSATINGIDIEKDDLIIPDQSISMAEHLLNSELLILKNANHASVVRNKKNVKIITRNIFKFFDNRV